MKEEGNKGGDEDGLPHRVEGIENGLGRHLDAIAADLCEGGDECVVVVDADYPILGLAARGCELLKDVIVPLAVLGKECI